MLRGAVDAVWLAARADRLVPSACGRERSTPRSVAIADQLVSWIVEDLTWGGVLFAFSLFAVLLLGSLVGVAFILVRISPTYFQDLHPRDPWRDRHPALRLTGRIARNLLGTILILVGIVLSFPGVPGQGLLTILIGLMLIDVPGKRRLERRIVGRPKVLRVINRLRRRFGRESLVLGRRRGLVATRNSVGSRPAA